MWSTTPRPGARIALVGVLLLGATVTNYSVAACAAGQPGPAATRPTVARPTATQPTATQPTATRPAAQGVQQAVSLPQWLLGHDWERIPTKKKIVALTFDAGANAAGLPSIRRTLAARSVPATFFLTGRWVQQYPARAKAVAADFRIGNHSMTHPHFTKLTNTQIRSQLTRAQIAIRTATGVSPRPLFRFPFGDRNARTITAVNNAGYVAVRWTVDTLGWEGTGAGITVASIVKRVLANLVPGEIVLMHVGSNPTDGSTLDADALPRIITKLRSLGYSFVTLNALLNPPTTS